MSFNKSIHPEQTRNGPILSFRGRLLPVEAYLAGYAALIARYQLRVPLHYEMAAISPKNVRRREYGWAIYPFALMPAAGDIDHLVFALKYEGIQLLTLKHIFERFDQTALEGAARAKPTSGYIRRVCYLFEWLTDKTLAIPPVNAGAYTDLVDKQQYSLATGSNEKRFRIRDNLPGTKLFCPMVHRTARLDDYIAKDLSARARTIVESAPPALIARAAAFLLLSDSKASFAIEGEDPPKDRLARWGFVVSKAGQIALTRETLIRLQRDLIGDARFVKIGLRHEGGFVGQHDVLGQPVPEHISANANNLESLLDGLCLFNGRSRSMRFHPVLAAACIAFGFVYIHPFEDGNGRIHRFLMHHVLAEYRYTPEQIVFPISSVILHEIPRYKDTLEVVSTPLLEWIEWRATEKGNVQVLNDTSDYYRFFDATSNCEFLFKCIETTIERDLPDELSFLEKRDIFHQHVTQIVDMGERSLDLLLKSLRQSHGQLSKRARSNEFRLLTEAEVASVEATYADLFTPRADRVDGSTG